MINDPDFNIPTPGWLRPDYQHWPTGPCPNGHNRANRTGNGLEFPGSAGLSAQGRRGVTHDFSVSFDSVTGGSVL